MIGALSGGEGWGSASSLYLAQQIQGVSGLNASTSSTGGAGGIGGTQSSASISGPGQLLSDLQQLHTQNPTAFQQVVTQIVSQLQAAAQQAEGPQSTFQSNLAAKFQSV